MPFKIAQCGSTNMFRRRMTFRESLLEEVKDLDEGEMAILARRKESTEGPDFRYRIDVYLAEAIAGQVRSIDGEGDVWRIRL
jgi:hypothetical protein